MNQKGFTLAEVLVALSIIGVIGVILVSFLTQTFRGSSKTQLIGVIKQNGQSALNIIDQASRFATGVTCTDDPTFNNAHLLAVHNQDGTYTRFRICNKTDATCNGSFPNGYISQDTNSLPSSYTESQFCNPVPNPDIVFNATNSSKLTDTDPKTGVAVTNGYFKVIKNSGNHDVVNIYFQLGPASGTGLGFENQLGSTNSATFQTSVVLR